MFGSLIEKWKINREMASLKKEQLFRDAFTIIHQIMDDEGYGLGKQFSQKFKEELIAKMLNDVIEIIRSENQTIANREKLSEAVCMSTMYQVLILPSKYEDEEDVTEMRGKPGISGELKLHLKEISEQFEEVKEVTIGFDNPTDIDIYNGCVYRYRCFWARAQLFHSLRFHLNDYPPEPKQEDWYLPFVAAMCAYHEHRFRDGIGLPEQNGVGDIEALEYYSFMNMVLNGVRYPNLEFQRNFIKESS